MLNDFGEVVVSIVERDRFFCWLLDVVDMDLKVIVVREADTCCDEELFHTSGSLLHLGVRHR